jgi:hypothetical protein
LSGRFFSISTPRTFFSVKQRNHALMRGLQPGVGGNGGGGERAKKLIRFLINVINMNFQIFPNMKFNMMRKIWKWRLLFSLWSSSFQSFSRLPTLILSVFIPLQSTLLCMELYRVFPNLGIHFNPTLYNPTLDKKNLKKIQLNANYNDYGQNWIFWEHREKTHSPIRFSRARSGVPNFG